MNNDNKLEVVSVRLVRDSPILSKHKIENPGDIVAVLGETLCEFNREAVCVINLKSDGTPINVNFASIGSISQSIACPREIFKSSILSNAASMILVHNHPSGNLKPSKEDCILTDRMIKLCHMMDIPLLDHVIVGGDNSSYFSFREKEMLETPHFEECTDYRELSFENLVAEENDGMKGENQSDGQKRRDFEEGRLR